MNLALRGRFLPRNLLLQAEGAERAVRCLARAAVQLAVRAQAVKFDYRGRSAPGQPPLRNRQRMCYAHSCMEEYRRAVRAPTLGCPGPLQPSVAICGAMADLWTGQPKKPATERSTRPRDACDPPGPLLMGRQPANSGALDGFARRPQNATRRAAQRRHRGHGAELHTLQGLCVKFG